MRWSRWSRSWKPASDTGLGPALSPVDDGDLNLGVALLDDILEPAADGSLECLAAGRDDIEVARAHRFEHQLADFRRLHHRGAHGLEHCPALFTLGGGCDLGLAVLGLTVAPGIVDVRVHEARAEHRDTDVVPGAAEFEVQLL